MKIFRDSSGRTSSGVTFWLMAAMRMKDRSGPGMVTVSDAGAGDVVLAERGFSWPEEMASSAALAEAEEQAHKQANADRKMESERRERFIIGYTSFENLFAAAHKKRWDGASNEGTSGARTK